MSIFLTSVGLAPDFIMHMKIKLFFSFVLVTFLAGIFSCSDSRDYSQSYIILLNKKKVGKEIIKQKTDIKGKLVCLSEQEMHTPGSKERKRRIIRTKMVFQEGKLFPVSYSYESSAGTSYDVIVKDGQIIKTLKKEGESQESTTPLEPGMLMLDLTVFHTIDYWIRKYEADKGGRQVLQTYLLPAATVERLSIVPDNTFIPEHESKVKNYEIKIGKELTMLLWVDKENRLYRMFIRDLNIEVIRSDLFDRLHKKIESGE
jgi:hypothetical protein